MAKLRHIALIVPDPEKAAKFFEDAFEMKVAGQGPTRGLCLRRHHQRGSPQAGGGREGGHLSLRHVGR